MTGSTTFTEVMAGPIRLAGEEQERELRLELVVTAPGRLRLWADTEARMEGRVVCAGWADAAVQGSMRIAPLAARRIRYSCAFTTTDGRHVHLDGWKSISYRHLQRSMTTLPVTAVDDEGVLVAGGVLRFDARRDLVRFLRGMRYRKDVDPQPSLLERA